MGVKYVYILSQIIHRTIKELIMEKCEVTGDPDDVKPAHTLEDEVIDNEIEDIIGTCIIL